MLASISAEALYGKLDAVLDRTLYDRAFPFARARRDAHVELVHWFKELLDVRECDVPRILTHFGLDIDRIAADCQRALAALPPGGSSTPEASVHLDEAVETAWMYASVQFGASAIRSGHLLVALLNEEELRKHALAISGALRAINVQALLEGFQDIVSGSAEQGALPVDGSAPLAAADSSRSAGEARGAALARFAVDLTARAVDGAIDPVIGRDEEIRQVIDVLMRRRQNNPILTGEAGVGKTAVVEGFALRIARGDVPPPLRGVRLMSLDIGLLQAGASVKGEFENRLRQVIEEVQASSAPVILFVDEAHTLIGAGGQAGTGDAANLMKPALARGTLRTIAATTWAEYKKYIERDPALTRRFQVIQVAEPSEAVAVAMMRGVAASLERHHGVLLLDSAIEASVRLSHRYIPSRQLPDKAVSLLDTACARVAVSQHARPAAVEDAMRRIEMLETQLSIIAQEGTVGLDVADRRSVALSSLETQRQALGELEARWVRERALVDEVLDLRKRLREEGGSDGSGRETMLAALRERLADLEVVQVGAPLMMPAVDEHAVASVVADWTGIPIGRMVKDEMQAVLGLADTLSKRVIGQNHGLEMIARRIQTARAGLDDPNKPVGVFMLVGPSGVGKTETALALAESLYGGEQNVITINMSEFQEKHTVSTLKGAPPGYVGYGEGGVLTEAVRRRPYSVVLLDEVEKAHPDVHELFFQVFDKATMKDGEGRLIDFRNTIILLTSNVGSDLVMNLCKDPDVMPEPEAIAEALRKPLLEVFPAALLGRIVTIPYFPLSDDMLGRIITLQLERVVARVRSAHGIPLGYDAAVVRHIAGRCTEHESGGRMIDAILTNTVLPRISRTLLGRRVAGEALHGVSITVRDGDLHYEFAEAPPAGKAPQ